MFKNVAGKIAFYAHDTAANVPKTGDAANLTAYVSKDGASPSALADTSAAELDATNMKGVYVFDVSATEANADLLVFACKSSTANVQLDPVIVFTIGDVRRWNGTAVPAPNQAGYPLVDVAYVAGTGATVADGTATAGGASTITLATGVSYPNDLLKGRTITLTGGTGAGQSRRVVSNTNATPSVVTVHRAWDVVPSTDTAYDLGPTTEGDVSASAVASVTGAVGSVTAAVTLPIIPTNWITAAGVAASALNGKGDWLPAAGYTAPPSAATVASAVRTELSTELGRVDAAVSSRSTYAGSDTPGTTTLLTRVTGAVALASQLPAGFDSLTITSGVVSADVKKVNAVTLTGNGADSPWGPA